MPLLELADIGSPDTLGILLTGSTLAALWVGWFKLARPKWRRVRDRVVAMFDTIAGRDEVRDPATGQTLPALPPLNERLGGIEAAMKQLVEVVASNAEAHQLLSDHSAELANHRVRIAELEKARDERIAHKIESAEMWRAVADRDVIDGDD